MGCDWWDVACQAKEAASSISNTANRELSNAGNSVNSALDAATGGASPENVAANLLTRGIIGFDDGQVQAGAWTRGVSEIAGELTGANQARRANNIAEQALADQRAEAERLRREQIDKMKNADIAASRKAGQAQANAYLTSSAAAGTQAYNNLTRDFLGL